MQSQILKAEFLVLHLPVCELLHRKFHYFENFHGLGKLLLFKEKQAENTCYSYMIIQLQLHLLLKETFLFDQNHFGSFHHTMKIKAETNNSKCGSLERE